jgi:hypothetical protein
MKDTNPKTHLQHITKETLAQENLHYIGSRGISPNNRDQGFIPAFLDTETGNIYRSRFTDGSPAPVHVLAGLPHALFDPDSTSNGEPALKRSVVPGFLSEGTFYSRAAAALATTPGHMH